MKILLTEDVFKYEETLYGKMKGSGSKGKHGQVKEATWRSIADTLYNVPVTVFSFLSYKGKQYLMSTLPFCVLVNLVSKSN